VTGDWSQSGELEMLDDFHDPAFGWPAVWRAKASKRRNRSCVNGI